MAANRLGNRLRLAALSISLIAAGAPAALADPPGYDFPDSWRPKRQELSSPPPVNAATARNSRDATDANQQPTPAKADNGNCCCDNPGRRVGQ
jgi:hypothetical protein